MTPQPNNSEWLETILRKVYNQGFDDRQPSGTEPFNRMTIDEAKAASQFRINTIVAERAQIPCEIDVTTAGGVNNILVRVKDPKSVGEYYAVIEAIKALRPAQLQPKEGENER